MLRQPLPDNFAAYRAIEALCAHFHIEAPALRWSTSRRGWYTHQSGKKPEASVISIGLKCWRGVEAALVHEAAHHLDFCCRGRTDHSRAFQEALVLVVQAWYGDQTSYPWHQEYTTVKAAGPRPKLCIDDILNSIEIK